MLRTFFFSMALLLGYSGIGQGNFNYSVQLTPLIIPNLPGLHSYAFAQANGKWLIIGGRKDGIHARQPFNAFPESLNNTDIIVIDVNAKQSWSASLNVLPVGIREQLQSANMNFIQQEDSLYIIGGYAYAASVNDHITFPTLTTVQVTPLINAVITGNAITSFFKQLHDERLAVTGGQLGKIGNRFYLVGGHRFDGRYNPMNHPTFQQEYTNQVRSFVINNSGGEPVILNYSAITDAVHLRRRDFNLLPQVFADGSEGYTISSGVFQPNADLPYLYPVDVSADGITAHTSFNQYLSNYHSAKASLFDSSKKEMYSIFFGGISQYYYQNGALEQDNQVPFVKTISLLTRGADGKFKEYKLPVEMPGLQGAGAEFIVNTSLPHTSSEIILLDKINTSEMIIGHIYGGISSTITNAFTTNSTGATTAGSTIYQVKLVKHTVTAIPVIDGNNPFSIQVFPNPFNNQADLVFFLEQPVKVYYFVTDNTGRIIKQGRIPGAVSGKNSFSILFDDTIAAQGMNLTVVFQNRFFVTEKILKK